MRRFIIFALAGPPLGVFVSIFIVIPLVALLDGTEFEPSFAQVETFLALVPFSSLIPALSCRSCRPHAPFAELVCLSPRLARLDSNEADANWIGQRLAR
jgi:hypothetical protein